VSYGTLRYLASEGAIVSYPMDRRLLELCEAVATSEDRFAAQPIRIPFHSDALPARARGLRATTLLSVEDGLPPPYYHTPQDTPDKLDEDAMSSAVDFTVALIRALDRDVGRLEAVSREPAGRV
jgi:Peptidase family M28